MLARFNRESDNGTDSVAQNFHVCIHDLSGVVYDSFRNTNELISSFENTDNVQVAPPWIDSPYFSVGQLIAFWNKYDST